MGQLNLDQYASNIKLDRPFVPKESEIKDKEQLVHDLLAILRLEKAGTQDIEIPDDYEAKRKLVRALLNIRQALPMEKEMPRKLDTLLQIELNEKAIIETEQLRTIKDSYPDTSISQADKISLWQGDITALRTDAITNAANEKLTGCMQPLHECVDNAIHSAAGPSLRDDCAEITHVQKNDEETGDAKITRGYNLPSSYVLHTVGPVVPQGDGLTVEHQEQLASCYKSALDLASSKDDIKTLAFCSISTGEFGFPVNGASKIAVDTVNEWLESNDHHFEKIIFNVFSEDNKEVYEQILKK